nr:hypothetical protein [Tanacetum cinerariifolium]
GQLSNSKKGKKRGRREEGDGIAEGTSLLGPTGGSLGAASSYASALATAGGAADCCLAVTIYLQSEPRPDQRDMWTDDMMEYYLMRCDEIKCEQINGHYNDFVALFVTDEVEEVRHGSASFIVQNDVSNCIDGSMSQMQGGLAKQFISFVYAENHEKDRRLLWKNVMDRNNIVNGSPWSLLGDFKVALNVEECSDNFSIKDKDM